MNSIETNQLINRIQKELIDSGMDTEKIIPMLSDLRALFSAAKQPRLTRMVRMTVEHIEENETFLIEMPEEEVEEEIEEAETEVEESAEVEVLEENEDDVEAEAEVEEVEVEEDTTTDLEKQIESLDYMLQLMTKPDNKFNVVELNSYFLAIVADAKQ